MSDDKPDTIRVLICGDRNWNRQGPVNWIVAGICVEYGPENVTIVEGEAKGADTMARLAAEKFGCAFDPYPANWAEHGKAAGPIRNKQMLVEGKPDVVVAYHDAIERSKGTRNMVEQARKAGLPVYVIGRYQYEEPLPDPAFINRRGL